MMENTTTQFTWDRVVRITHWLIALGIGLNLFVLRPGSEAHQLIGYGIFLAVILRLLWAITAAKYPARLRDMCPTIRGFQQHIRELKQRKHQSHKHNAIGLLFIWSVWLLIMAAAITGYLAAITSETDSLLPYSTWLEDIAYDYPVEKIHGVAVQLIQWLALIHILAVFITGKITHHNYLRPMIHALRDKKS